MEALQSQSPSRWRILGLSALVILVFEALGIILGTFIGGFFTLLLMIFIGFGIGGVAEKMIPKWGAATAVTGFFLAVIISSMNASRPLWLTLTSGKSSLDYPISVADAPEYDVTFFTFKNGEVKPDLAGYDRTEGYVRTRTGGRGYRAGTVYYVAPVVKDDWTPDQAVTLWAVCTDTWELETDFADTDACRKEWKKDHKQGVEIEPGKIADLQPALKNAETEFGLQSYPNAKFILWSKDAAFEARSAKGSAIGFMIITHLVFGLFVLFKKR